MKNIIITVAFIALGIFLANSLILGTGDTSIKGGAKSIVDTQVNTLKTTTFQ